MRARVLVTRPEPGATRSAEKVRALGFTPVVLPLTRTAALQADLHSQEYDAVAATSASALRHASEELVASLASLPMLAVGASTAEAARRRGLAAISADGSASDLVALAASRLAPGARLAYLTGRVRLPDFERMLAQGGMAVTPIETYDTVPAEFSDLDLSAVAGSEPMAALLLYSALAADRLLGLRERLAADIFGGSCAICMSGRIAGRLGQPDGMRICVARAPHDDAMMDMLAETIGRGAATPLS